MTFYCVRHGSGTRFRVHLTPRAAKDGFGGLYGDALKVRVKAPPIDGRANEALTRYLAEILGVSPRTVILVSGRTSRNKMIEVDGLTPEEVRKSLGRP